jgi:hypothetical protein
MTLVMKIYYMHEQIPQFRWFLSLDRYDGEKNWSTSRLRSFRVTLGISGTSWTSTSIRNPSELVASGKCVPGSLACTAKDQVSECGEYRLYLVTFTRRLSSTSVTCYRCYFLCCRFLVIWLNYNSGPFPRWHAICMWIWKRLCILKYSRGWCSDTWHVKLGGPILVIPSGGYRGKASWRCS